MKGKFTFQNVRTKVFHQMISNLESFVSKTKHTPLDTTSDEIATAILLTGEGESFM